MPRVNSTPNSIKLEAIILAHCSNFSFCAADLIPTASEQGMEEANLYKELNRLQFLGKIKVFKKAKATPSSRKPTTYYIGTDKLGVNSIKDWWGNKCGILAQEVILTLGKGVNNHA